MGTDGLPSDYEERVYAGVLGKVIGVYLGRPFEGWSYDRIMKQLGEIDYYVHDKVGVPLIVTDDDISGTFTFIRALADHGVSKEITPAQIGDSWLNYIIPDRSILWWGGMGNSTEHTAYLRLVSGIKAPQSGSMALNGKVVAEQIGAQIFIDGWAMVCPGDPELAADFARRAGSVSHDGEAIYGAQIIAAMEALAFVEDDIDKILDEAVRLIPRDSVIFKLIEDVRNWCEADNDWRSTRERIAAQYGYDKYGGNCHMVPNHALIIHSILHADDDFSEAMKIVNTCGWDTDCNSGNVGCFMGIKKGLDGIDEGLKKGLNWREPIADRIYMPTADGSRAISDCVTEALEISRMGRILNGDDKVFVPKNGAKFHFEFQGSVQGFTVDLGTARLANLLGSSRAGKRSLQVQFESGLTRISTPVFIPTKELAKYFEGRGYALLASPKLHAGQTISAGVNAASDNESSVTVRLCYQFYGAEDEPTWHQGESVNLDPGKYSELHLQVQDVDSFPVSAVGLSFEGAAGECQLDYLTWQGEPDVRLTRPHEAGSMWRRAWVNGVDKFHSYAEPFRLIQNSGTGLLMQGTRDWRNYTVTIDATPHLAEAVGVAARVQGMRRYYALKLSRPGKVQLVKMLDVESVLDEMAFDWQFGVTYMLSLNVTGSALVARVNGEVVFETTDDEAPLMEGGIALLVTEGRTATQAVVVTGADEKSLA